MTQVARPASDVFNSGWTPTPVYAQINAPVPTDATWVISPQGGGSFDVQLAPLARPITGPHTLTVRFEKTDPGAALVTFALLQGTQIIAARSFLATQAFTNYTLVLREQEVDLITDYTNLRLRVLVGAGSGSAFGSFGSGFPRGSFAGSLPSGSLASGSGLTGSRSGSGPAVLIPNSCCPPSIPAVLHVTPSDSGGSCPNLVTTSFPITYDPATKSWTGSAQILPNNTVTFGVVCANVGGSFSWFAKVSFSNCTASGVSIPANAGGTCNPFSFSFNLNFPSNQCNCGGSGVGTNYIQFTVTT